MSYDGIRCDAEAYKVYALGDKDGTWRRLEGDWRLTEPQWTKVLRREYFCPARAPIRSVAEGLEALRAGRHPSLKY